MSRTPHPAFALPALLALTLLSGCGGTNSHTITTPTPISETGPAISGRTLLGIKPLPAATVQLYAAGTTGNGSAPTTLSTAATTDTSGAFTIPAGYTCPSAASQLYLVARGGTPSTASNPAIALIAPLGRCDAVLATSTYILNEATTAATVWALSQFLSPAGNLGATATNTTGLANAVAIALSLAGNTSGTSPGNTFPATGTSPAPRINALANLLNTCTASTSSGPCAQLFNLTGTSTDTLAAALNLVRHPGTNVATLFLLAQASTAFSPTLPATPSDWTLPLTFTGGGMLEPGPLAVDSTGNVWVASYSGVVSKFDPLGAPAFPSGITGLGLSESYGLAIDPSNNIWITDESSPSTINAGYGAVTVLNSAGQSLSGPTGFASGGLNFPIAVALDTDSTAWIIDYGNSHLTLLNPSGQPLSGAAGYFSSAFAFPVALALDASHNAWVASSGGQNITRISANGQQTLDVTCCNTPSGLALDAAGNVWVANYLGDTVSEVNPANTAAPSQYAAPSLNHPQGIAVDGAGHIWIASFRGNSITELAGAITPQTSPLLSPPLGWAPTPTSLQAFALAIDASGNVWISNFASASLTELVGLATPVKTPLNALPQLP